MSDLLAIALIVLGFCALVFTAALLWLGLRFWLMCGTFDSAHRIIDSKRALDEQQLDELARRGFKEAQKRGMLP